MIVDCAEYDQGARRPGRASLSDLGQRERGDGRFVWLGLFEPTAEEFSEVMDALGLHPLASEDAVEAHQRPKLEIYDGTLFLVLKTARYDDPTETVEFGELLIFVGADFIVVVRHGAASALAEVRAELEADPERLALGPAAVLHGILDRVVDDYAPVMAGIDDDIGEVEAAVFSDTPTNPVERIYKLKREVLGVHRALGPLVDPLHRLSSQPLPTVPPAVRSYFRDVEDHLVRVTEQNETNRDLLTSVLEANLTRVSVRQNEDMRKISAWVAMAAVPTLVAGVYGMNFDHMPELDWRFGYPAVLAAMAVICLTLFRYFRRSGWI
ncbi:magnesium/cobalt transporter CorA [Actinomarinicola tropica]|uniref:Magnesium transport protein CorA n=1 Tax=Actinomarinicola tropica TaxID=2789776 RepID=A0A5Q2RH04_9ACTN|nr:magnesium/cobalt transporter CorA [Actinomarinicola tropica]QGG95023.1 magnesium/cobalt transporter CorA [Actinomarinicola tropica]